MDFSSGGGNRQDNAAVHTTWNNASVHKQADTASGLYTPIDLLCVCDAAAGMPELTQEERRPERTTCSTFRVSMHGRCHVFPWLVEFSGVVLSCFTLSR